LETRGEFQLTKSTSRKLQLVSFKFELSGIQI